MQSLGLGRVAAFVGLATVACEGPSAPGPQGADCERTEDCNAAVCGALTPCVRGFCVRDAPPVVRYCSDAGTGATVYECDLWDDCNPGACCGENLVACVLGRCDPDAPRLHVPCPCAPGPGRCGSDAECAVVLPFDGCCGACRDVMARAEVAGESCWYEEDRVPEDRGPPECYAECTECTACDPAPIGAQCRDGQCQPVFGPCQPFSPGARSFTAAALDANRFCCVDEQVTVLGTASAGDPVCGGTGCDPGPRCRAPILLDGVVEIRGSSCGVRVECTDAACAELTCAPFVQNVRYRVTGWWRDAGGGRMYLDLLSYEEEGG